MIRLCVCRDIGSLLSWTHSAGCLSPECVCSPPAAAELSDKSWSSPSCLCLMFSRQMFLFCPKFHRCTVGRLETQITRETWAARALHANDTPLPPFFFYVRVCGRLGASRRSAASYRSSLDCSSQDSTGSFSARLVPPCKLHSRSIHVFTAVKITLPHRENTRVKIKSFLLKNLAEN